VSARTTLFAVLVLALASMACQPPAQEAGPLSEEDVAAIRAVPQSYTEAMLANDYAAVAALWAEDAVLMAPNEPLIEGRAAIQASYEAMPVTVTEYSNRTLRGFCPESAGTRICRFPSKARDSRSHDEESAQMERAQEERAL
jgi:uncharacterized protein (TIGR02246 family)